MKDNLDARKTRWTKEGVLEAIHNRVEKNLPLNSFAVRQDNEALWQAAKRYCGGWASALKEAGVTGNRRCSDTPRARPGSWSREIILARIQEYRDQGASLGAHQMQKVDNRLVSAAGYYFGSWARALEAAGVNPDAVRSSVPWTRDRVVMLIQDAKKSGADLADRSIRFWNRALYRAACDHFGTWEQAVQAALKENVQEARWNPDRIRKLVKDYVAHGFSVNEALRYHPRLSRAIIHHYGSIENLIRVLGLPETVSNASFHGDQAVLLRAWRTDKGLAPEKLAQILDVSPYWVEAYENGKMAVPWNIFWHWAAICGKRRDALRQFLPKPTGIKSRGSYSLSVAAHRPAMPFASNSACFVVDSSGTIRHWNKNLSRITGIEARDSEGLRCTEIVRTYLSAADPYCGESCPMKSRPLGERPPEVHWQNPQGFLVRMHMITDKEGWTTHWIEPVSANGGNLG